MFLGVDVGFSLTRKTTGLAWRIGEKVEVCLAGSSWASRQSALPKGVQFSIVALDAPVVVNDRGILPRACEAVFYRRPFWNRCRPGLSHHGRGLDLRRAGRDAVLQFSSVLMSGQSISGPKPSLPVVEAFPNTFLGVLVPERDYHVIGRAGSQSKSDWLYDRTIECGALDRVLQRLGWNEPETLDRLKSEKNHDKRAALVCLLTAGLAHAGDSTVVGDVAGGWFWLPPKTLWEPWALEGLEEAITRSRQQGFENVCVR
jgi:predicted nuclease with RNAse H fold